MVKLDVERLPDMHVARAGHVLLSVDDEIVAVGGHTDGFVPTKTAEYYKDGEWHLVETVYPHDNGFGVVLKSGKVLIGGGHEQSLGIGQTFPVELYDPSVHTFKGFSCLDMKRALCRAVELDSGKVVVAGNHYNDDSFELFDGTKLFTKAGDVSEKRCSPYLLRSGKMDAVLFGKLDEKMRCTESQTLDRLRGGSCEIELLMEWAPFAFDIPLSSDISFIGDAAKGDYRYLIAGEKKDGSLMVVCVEDTVFTPVRTSSPIPATFDGEKITYLGVAIADRARQRCYVRGTDSQSRQYFLCFDYSDLGNPAGVPITLYYSRPIQDAGSSCPILTSDGDLLLAGGISDSNFSPFKTVYLMKTGDWKSESNSKKNMLIWLCSIAALTVLTIVVVLIVHGRHGRGTKLQPTEAHPLSQPDSQVVEEQKESEITSMPQEEDGSCLENSSLEQLFTCVCRLMDENQLFLNSELKLADVAVALGTNNSYVSSCINSKAGCSFTQFVNRYRVEYAKEKMLQRNGEKLSSIGLESGFSNETSFFRAFKAVTGMTPGEWLSKV